MYIEFATRRYSIGVGRAAETAATATAGAAAGAAATSAAERAATPATNATSVQFSIYVPDPVSSRNWTEYETNDYRILSLKIITDEQDSGITSDQGHWRVRANAEVQLTR